MLPFLHEWEEAKKEGCGRRGGVRNENKNYGATLVLKT